MDGRGACSRERNQQLHQPRGRRVRRASDLHPCFSVPKLGIQGKLGKLAKEGDALTEQTVNRAAGQVQEGAQQWLGMLQTLAEQIQKQQQNSQQMIQELMNTYMQLHNTPGSYVAGQAQQQQQTLQQISQQ